MGNLEQKTVEILDKLDAAISHYSPQVYDAAIASVQISAIGNLSVSFMCLVFAFYSWRMMKKANSILAKDLDKDALEIVRVASVVIYTIIMIVVLLFSIISILDVWNWTAIFNPKLAFAHKIMGL